MAEKGKKKGNLSRFSLVLAVIPVLVYGCLYQNLPEQVPSHFDMEGNVNDFMSKQEFWLVALLPLLLWGLFLVLPTMDPKKENYAKFAKAYQCFHFGMVAFMDFIFFVSLSGVFATDTTYMSMVIYISVGLLFLWIGKIMPQLKPNFFMGIKTPWTLSSETVWEKTHKVGGVCFRIGGICFCILPFFGSAVGNILLFPLIILLLYPIPLSYFLYAKEEKKNQSLD